MGVVQPAIYKILNNEKSKNKDYKNAYKEVIKKNQLQ